ncbi:GNAT family N-acetyltransferase [Hyalangium versicolor]|uniref:GNAT family N-acetyltransferase n=1 Tax=Hyalangium versicolor TaxID=2861190 RepID=UPI001CC96662|nr:GNAT family N-acetyltransferase [Hyalangium versicolor]
MIRLPLLTLRPWAMSDIDALARHANDRRIWLNLRDRFPHPYTRADAEGWIRFCEGMSGPPTIFAIDVGGEAVGSIGLELHGDVHRTTAEIGYWLGASHWGRGLATMAVGALTRYAFEELGLERVHAFLFEWNPASRRVLEKAGYTFEGRMRRYVIKDGRVGDVLLYARIRDDAPVPH